MSLGVDRPQPSVTARDRATSSTVTRELAEPRATRNAGLRPGGGSGERALLTAETYEERNAGREGSGD